MVEEGFLMAFGKRAIPSGDDVLEQVIGHFQEGGSIVDFVVNSDPLARLPLRDIERSPAERAAERAYLSLLLRYGEPDVNTRIQAEVNRSDAAAKEHLRERRAEADRGAAERGTPWRSSRSMSSVTASGVENTGVSSASLCRSRPTMTGM